MLSVYTSGEGRAFSHNALDTKVAAFETQNGESIANNNETWRLHFTNGRAMHVKTVSGHLARVRCIKR